MLRRQNPNRYPFWKPSIATYILFLIISADHVHCSEELNPFSNQKINECYLDNVLQSFISPDDVGSIQMQALRQGLWRILTSPALNENIMLPNYDLLSDGKLLYEQPLYENKRSQTVFEKILSASPYFKKYIATIVKANAIQSRPSMMGKRSVATLAKNGQLPTLQSPEENSETQPEKRDEEAISFPEPFAECISEGVAALKPSGDFDARFNVFIKCMKETSDILERNGHLEYPAAKRNLGSLARNGELIVKSGDKYSSYYKRNIQNLMKTGGLSSGKRNLAALMRNMQNTYNDNAEHKRNIGTVARDWALPNQGGAWHRGGEDKRNVAALLRQDSYLHSVNRHSASDVYPTPEAYGGSRPEDKRNLPSIKTGPFKYGKQLVKRSVAEDKEAKAVPAGGSRAPSRQKRQADEYFSEISNDFPLPDVPKSDAFDYDEFVKALTGDYLSNNKRFLGNIPLSRMTELGKLSLSQPPPVSNATPTSPTYRRRQYLLSRTQPEETD